VTAKARFGYNKASGEGAVGGDMEDVRKLACSVFEERDGWFCYYDTDRRVLWSLKKLIRWA
jgi:hypothetical protein